jgi:Zn-dependent oligopeptidase
MFHTICESDPMSRAAGMRYRKAILEKRSSVDEMEMLQMLLGRQPAEALLGDAQIGA